MEQDTLIKDEDDKEFSEKRKQNYVKFNANF